MSLAVIVPTRGRPGNAARLAKAFRETHALDALPVFVADHNDPELPAYRALLDEGVLPRLMIQEATNGGTGMCAALNYAARRYATLYGAVGFMGDDHLPRTANWDSLVLEQLDALTPRIVYGNDLLQGPALPTAVFMQSRLVQAMGYMAPPALQHLYIDNFWKALGEALDGLVYLPDVIIEHLHPAAGKAPMDDRYRAVNAAETDRADREEWLAWSQSALGFAPLVAKVRREYGLDQSPAA
jgi:hypothetical protein